MALIISDRVKETSITSGTGSITLSGAFGGFQSFLAAIGDGNQTYYVIENEARWEVGIGTYTSSSNTLSRDTVLSSSNSDAKISLDGVSFVFCTLPADRTLFKDVSNDFFADNQIGCSGLLTLRRESAGNFFHAYTDDSYDETISLYTDSASAPEWKLGLKDSPSSVTDPPTYAYIYGEDSNMGLIASSLNQLNLTQGDGLVISHKGNDVFEASSPEGVIINSTGTAYPALTVNGGALLSSDIQRWTTSAGTVLAAIDKDGDLTAKSFTATDGSSSGVIFFNDYGVLTSDSSLIYDSSNEYLGIGTDSPDYELDVNGNIGLNQFIYHNGDTNTYIRFRGDQIDFVAGGRTMLTLDEAGTDKVIVNNGRHDVDFQVEGDSDTYLIYTNAANDRVGIGTNDPDYKLDVVGTGRMSSIIFAGDSTEQTTAYTNQDVLVSGWADATFINAGTIPAQILANSASGVAISGWAKAYVDGQDHSVSSATTALNASGDFLRVSGIAVSGWARAYVDTQDHSAVAVSGWASGTFIEATSTFFHDATNEVLALRTANPNLGGYALDVNGDVSVSGNLELEGGITSKLEISSQAGTSVFYDTIILNDLSVMNDLTVYGENTLKFAKVSGVSGVMDQLVLQNERPSDQALIIRNHVSQTTNLFETQGANSGVLMSIDPSGSVFSSGTISASGGVLFKDLVPNDTSLTLYNDGGTLKFNGSNIDAAATTLVSTSGDFLRTSGIAVSGWAKAYVDGQDHSATTAVNASGDFLRTSGVAVSGWTAYTTSVNTTNIAATGATNAAAIVVNTTALNASGDFLRTSGIAVSGWAKAYVDGKSHTDTTYTGVSGIHLIGTEFKTSGIANFSQITFGEVGPGGAATNIRIGDQAGDDCPATSNSLIAVGYQAADSLKEASDKIVAIGTYAGKLASGDYGIFIGQSAGEGSAGDKNIFIGEEAGYGCAGSRNIEISTSNPVSSALDDEDQKINIEYTIIGDTAAKKLAIGNVTSSDVLPDATVEIKPKQHTDIGLIVQGDTSHSANLTEWQNSSEIILAHVTADGSIASSGTVSASGGILLNDLAPTTTTNKLYNDGGTLKFNGSAVDVTATNLVNTSGDFLRTSGIAVSGWTKYTTSANATNISTNSTNITANTTAINASGNFLRTSGIAVSGWATHTMISAIGGVDNRIATFTGASGLSGESDLVYDGNMLTVSGILNLAKAVKTTIKSNTDGSTITFDLNESSSHAVTLGGNRTLEVVGDASGQKFTTRLLQDGDGSRTVTWFNWISWAGGSAPTLTTTASKADMFGFVARSGGFYDGFVIGQNI